jgi:WD40 repeat protein
MQYGSEISTFPEERRLNHYTDVVVVNDVSEALFADVDGNISFWDVATGEQTSSMLAVESEGIRRIAVHEPTNRLLALSDSGRLFLWDLSTRTRLGELRGQRLTTTIDFSPDGARALGGAADGSMMLWDVATLAPLMPNPVSIGQSRITALAFTPDGSQALIGDYEGYLGLWDLASGAEVLEFIGHTEEINAITFNHAGNQFASGAADLHIFLWELDNDLPVKRLDRHLGGVSDLEYNPDDSFILSGGWDGNNINWLVALGEPFFVWRGHRSSLMEVGWSNDASSWYSVSDDGIFYLWDYRTPEEFVAWALENRYFRDTTCEERQRYGLDLGECPPA